MGSLRRPAADRAASGGNPFGRRGSKRVVLLEEAVTAYLGALQASAAPATTRRTYGSGLRLLVRHAVSIGRSRLQDLSVALVRGAMVTAMDPKVPHGHSWKGGEISAINVAAAAGGMARWLVAEGVPNVADLSGIQKPKPPQRIQPRLEANEFQHLEAAICRRLIYTDGRRRRAQWTVIRDLALINLMADTALRAFEISMLDVSDIDLDEGTVSIQQGKGHKPRILAIADADPMERSGGPTVKALRDYLMLRCEFPGTALFLGQKRQRLSPASIRDAIHSWCRDAGLDSNRPPHTFRRGWFTDSYQADPRSLPVLTARMGWSNASSDLIRRYTRGADMDFAKTQRQMSMSNQWRRARPPSRQTQRPSPGNFAGNPTRADESRANDYGQFNRRG